MSGGPQRVPERQIACSVCEEFHPIAEFRWFNLEGLRAKDAYGRYHKLPHETVAEDPDGVLYCGRCARFVDSNG